ncbi:MAG: hypothetical protein PSX36_14410 [bacterium]|nr:hypothetical protein [bacterium]
MKRNKIVFGLSILSVCSMLLLTDCKKKSNNNSDPVTPDETGQSSTDSRDAQSENDAAINDINDVISSDVKLSGKSEDAQGTSGSICGLVVDSSLSSTGVIKLNYIGTTCNNRTRTGSIRLSMLNYALGARWKNAGTVIKVDYINYKITRASDQKSIMLNGTQNLINVSGGTWLNLLVFKNQASLISTVTGTNLNVTWQDGKTAIYNINRRITYTIPGNILTCQAEGIGTNNSLTSLENYGTTRDGDAFTSQVTTPIIWNLTCGFGAPIQGGLKMKVASKNFDLVCLYGVNSAGTPVTPGSVTCPFGWKLQWTLNNASQSKVIAYN